MKSPEILGLAALVFALITAWLKLRPALRKIEVEEDASLRSDLLSRITHLEDFINNERDNHHNIILEIRQEHASAMLEMQQRHDMICKDYEDKLRRFQERVDVLMEQLLKRK